MTVHHLLTHTSGIADYFEEENVSDDWDDFSNLWIDRPSYRMLRPIDFLPMFGGLPPYRAPAQRFQYSNAGYVVLGLIIEELTRQPYTEVVTRRVFAPAGMHSSGFFALDEAHPGVAVGHLPPREPGGVARSNIFSLPSIGGADGGASSNAEDLDRFLSADGTLGPLRDVILTPHCPVSARVAMGYGVYLKDEGMTGHFGHGGADPGYEVLIHRFPELDTNVIALCNMNNVCGDVRDLLVDGVKATA